MAFFVNARHLFYLSFIQARIIPWAITNNIGVDAKRDFSI